jgi:hypothetical protein
LKEGGVKVLLITGDADDKTRQRAMKDINGAVRNYDALVVSPALFTGVDLSEPYFDDVFLLATNKGNHRSSDFMQVLHRVRHPIGEVHVWVKHVDHGKTTDVDQILRESEIALRPSMLTGLCSISPLYEALSAHYVSTKAAEHLDINNLQATLNQALKNDNYEIIPVVDHDQQLEKAIKELSSRTNKESALNAIREAPTEAFHIEGNRIILEPRLMNMDAETRAALQYSILNGYSRDDFREIIRDIDPRKFEEEIENFELMLLPLEEIRKREANAIYLGAGINPKRLEDRARLLQDVSTHAKEIVKAAPLALGRLWLLALRISQKLLFRCLLIEIGGLESPTPLTKNGEGAEKLLTVFRKHERILVDYYRQKVPDKDKVFSTLHSLVAKAGLELCSQQRRIDKKPVREYRLCKERVSLMKRVLERRKLRSSATANREGVTVSANSLKN